MSRTTKTRLLYLLDHVCRDPDGIPNWNVVLRVTKMHFFGVLAVNLTSNLTVLGLKDPCHDTCNYLEIDLNTKYSSEDQVQK